MSSMLAIETCSRQYLWKPPFDLLISELANRGGGNRLMVLGNSSLALTSCFVSRRNSVLDELR
ncbi:MAG: hypothetical protein V3R76_05005 [Gammaproteobacteria bacterium]